MENIRTSTKAYMILISLTSLSFIIGLAEVSSIWLVVLLWVFTFIKGKIIIDYFMGMHEYMYRWTNFSTLWLCIVVLLLLGVYGLAV